jgi:hypothetical protein
MRFSVIYTEDDAFYPAPKREAEIVADTNDEAWEKATALGYVKQIRDLDSLRVVFSDAWDFNFMDLSKKQVAQNF